jgi:hypothetical protein
MIYIFQHGQRAKPHSLYSPLQYKSINTEINIFVDKIWLAKTLYLLSIPTTLSLFSQYLRMQT